MHLIISLREPAYPVIHPFRVIKEPTDFGVDERNGHEGSEQAYPGPEASRLHLAFTDTLLASDRN